MQNKEEQKTCGWKQPIYLFESAAQNGKIPPENMRWENILWFWKYGEYCILENGTNQLGIYSQILMLRVKVCEKL